MHKPRIAIDGDGVLFDYNRAYADAWKLAFGVYPQEKEPNAYWPWDRWDVEFLAGDKLKHFRTVFDEQFWESLQAQPGALQACQDLYAAGYELVCVTALETKFCRARQLNLLQLGFPIEMVLTTPSHAAGESPKALVLELLRPVAFVDDYLPYMDGVNPAIHQALITRNPIGSPNAGEALSSVSSMHGNLLEFSQWWLANRTDTHVGAPRKPRSSDAKRRANRR